MGILKYIAWPKPGWFVFHGFAAALLLALGAAVKFA